MKFPVLNFVAIAVLFVYCSNVQSLEDKFVKRYALMKLENILLTGVGAGEKIESGLIILMYESCFGPEVVKDVQKEMKVATAKCSGMLPSKSNAGLIKSSGMVKMPVSVLSTLLQQQPHTKHPPEKSDLDKLQLAILAGYNKHFSQQVHSANSVQQNHLFGSGFMRPWTTAYPGNGPFYATHNAYMPLYPETNPFYQSPFFPTRFFQTARNGRDLDSLANKISGRIKNITCVMQELGYLNEKLEPDFARIIERINKLKISVDLKKDISDGVKYCRKFSSCIPDDDNTDKLSTADMAKPTFFFRCYKHKKMEACVIKDIRQRYAAVGDSEDGNILAGDRSIRGKTFKDENDELALYEFVYGEEPADSDLLF